MTFLYKYINFLLSVVWCVFLLSCSELPSIDTPQRTESVDDRLVPVTIAVPTATTRAPFDLDDNTRMELEEDGTTVRWNEGDKIALWADNGSTYTLSARPFTLLHFSESYTMAYFSATIDAMADGDYTYYATYPVPTSTSGTTADFNLPAIQDGRNNLQYAVMVAPALRAGALTNSDTERPSFDLKHKCHILKITIPESKNLLGEPIERLEINFPTEVVGRLTLDLTDVEAPMGLSEGSKTLTLHFPEPVNAGDVVYAVIAPVDASAGSITFRGYSARRETELIGTPGKNFRAGHTTPIKLTIPTLRYMTRLYFSIGENFLGEQPNSFTVMVNGGTFPDGSTTKSFATNTANSYEVSYEGPFTDNFSGKTLTYTFDSDNAIVSNTQTAPTIDPYSRNTLPAQTVPYLFFEDFSGISSFENGTVHKTSDSSDYSAISLDQYGLAGWMGARIGGGAGQNLRICSRVEMGLWIAARYDGRVDTPVLSGLKSGASVKIQVDYDYAGDRYEATGSGGYPVYAAGVTTRVVSKGGDDIPTPAVSGVQLAIDGPNKNGTYYGNTPHHHSYTMAGCTNATRLSWSVTNNRASSLAGNGMYWLYVDNIKVSIAN